MNKRLIIIFVCIAVFVLTLVVGAVVFTVSDVNILFQSDENIAFDKAKILETGGIKKGQSVFTFFWEQASEKIEKQFPKLKVIKIERVFPNKVRIHLDTRKAIFKMAIANTDSFAVLDREFKIIDIINDGSEVYGDDIVVPITGYSYAGGENPLGDFINNDSPEVNSLKEILLSLESFEVVNERVPATFESIKIIDNTIHIKSKLGITLVVRMGTNISAKLQCDGIYNVFYTMNGDDRQLPNYLYMNNNGDISNSAKLEFDK